MPVIVDAQQVREIDVIAVALDRDPDWSGWRAVPGDVVGTWTDRQVDAVLGLVAALPAAEQMRCFVPGYAIRLRSGAVVLAEVAFCFRCHNADHPVRHDDRAADPPSGRAAGVQTHHPDR